MPQDLDKGGALRLWERTYLGPSLGWIMQQVTAIKKVTIGGTTTIERGITSVEVNVAANTTINLPPSIPYPGTISNPITITDTGGNAATFPITIVPNLGELIMGLASITIDVEFGSFTLVPDTVTGGWVQQ